MRVEGATVLLALLCGCAPADASDEPIGELFLWADGDPDEVVHMYHDDDRIELRRNGVRVAIGTLTAEGLTAWADAVASVDPTMVPDPAEDQCAPIDGIDVCVDVEHPSGPLQVCYCILEPPPPELVQFDAYFSGLAEALVGCESSPHVVIDTCEAA